MNYDFNILDPIEFEQLICDLFSKEWNTVFESFKPGADEGIDLRHCLNHKNTIVQCKRYNEKKINQLKQNLKKELTKIEKLKPQRYILATSIPLSKKDKDSIHQILQPWCKISDIYGKNEITTLLKKHEDVERSHFKLWISSTTVLEQIIHSDILNYSQYKAEELKKEIGKLIPHKALPEALKKIQDNNHVLIAGMPGIGKTTLAKMICCHLIVNGYQVFWVTGSAENAWKIAHKEKQKKTIIVYDDFLGRSKFNIEKFDKNEDHQLTSLIKKSSESENLVVILTTREYILEDAKAKHGHFAENSDEIEKYTISLEHYTFNIKARILFSHLLFSDLPDKRIEAILKSRTYAKIINHKNFNPRIIENIAKHSNSKKLDDNNFINFLEESFENPSSLWEHPFEQEISEMAREILYIICTFGNHADINDIQKCITAKWKASKKYQEIQNEFTGAVKQLEGNFITTNREVFFSKEHYISSFSNPSIEEFIERKLKLHPEYLIDLKDALLYSRQILEISENFIRTLPESEVKDEVCEHLKERLQETRKESGKKIGNKTPFEQAKTRAQYFDLIKAELILKQKLPSFEKIKEIITNDITKNPEMISQDLGSSTHKASQLLSYVNSFKSLAFEDRLKTERLIRSIFTNAMAKGITDSDIYNLYAISIYLTKLDNGISEDEIEFFEEKISDFKYNEIELFDDTDDIATHIEYLTDIERYTGVTTEDVIEKLSEKMNEFDTQDEGDFGFNTMKDHTNQDKENLDIDSYFLELKNR